MREIGFSYISEPIVSYAEEQMMVSKKKEKEKGEETEGERE